MKNVKSPQRDRAETFLREQLRRGPKRLDTLIRAAMDERIGDGTLIRSAKKIGIIKKRGMWSLPQQQEVKEHDEAT